MTARWSTCRIYKRRSPLGQSDPRSGATNAAMIFAAGLLVAILSGIGCRTAEPPPALRPQYTSMKPLGVLYGKFLARSGGHPPKSEEQFRQFLATYGEKRLAALGVTDVDPLFLSPRDGQPLVVFYGKLGPPGPAGQPYVAYEQSAIDGQRYVASAVGSVAVMDDQRFNQIFTEQQ